MTDDSDIKPELQLSAATAPALDRNRLVLSKVETAFLRDSISQDEEEMHERIFAVQARYGHSAVRDCQLIVLVQSLVGAPAIL